ncbi:MAG: hypothetical protein NTY64_03410 [Deltaproteobacteria bacterium]|nr:hypothetical protein [Deltaproteobacteria bacterium]
MAKKSKRNLPPSPCPPSEILKILKDHPEQGITLTQITQTLDMGSDQRQELRQILGDLLAEGKIIRRDRRHYSLPPKAKAIVGRIQAHRDGYGFLIPEDSRFPDMFLGKNEIRDLMHRDRVSLDWKGPSAGWWAVTKRECGRIGSSPMTPGSSSRSASRKRRRAAPRGI